MNYIKAITVLILFSVSSMSIAGPSGAYLGGKAIYGTYEETISGLSFDDSAFGVGLYGGYRFGVGNALDYFAIEGSYQTFGEYDESVLGSVEKPASAGFFFFGAMFRIWPHPGLDRTRTKVGFS